MWKKMMLSCLAILLGGMIVYTSPAEAAALSLYTPYTGLSATPGENLTYDVNVINDENTVQHVTFKVEKLPEDWEYSIRAGGHEIKQLSIRSEDEEDIIVDINVPLEIEKGDYQFNLVAESNNGNKTSLPFHVHVAEKGTFKTVFSSSQPNMEGHADSAFSYSATIKNQTVEEQHYGLSANAPEGWTVQFKSDGNSVTSITVDPNESKNVIVDVIPAEQVIADSYKIPVVATSGTVSEEIELEAVITGKYDLELTTPTGNLSSDITAGSEKSVDLVVENKGTVDITDIDMSAGTPPNWNVTFNQNMIPLLEAGEAMTIKATITAPSETIAGDYVTAFRASTPDVSSEANFRMSVKTSTVWGFLAIFIIAVVLGGLYAIFRKYGRR